MIYDILGALLHGFIVWNLIYWIVNAATKYKKEKVIVLVWSLVISFVIIIIEGWLLDSRTLFFNSPMVILFFLYDFMKVNRNKKEQIAPLDR